MIAKYLLCAFPTTGQTFPCGTSNVIQIPANSPPIEIVDVGTPGLQGYWITSFSLTSSQSWATVVGAQIILNGGDEQQTIRYDIAGFPIGQYCAYFPQSFSGVSMDPNCISSCTVSGSSLQRREIDVVSVTSFQLIDPVPDLVSGNAVKSASQLQGLRTRGRVVSGVSADGVTQVVVKIQTNSPGHQFAVTLFNDQGAVSLSANEDGGLGNPGDTSPSQSNVTVTAGGLTAEGLAYAFAVYRSPIDFARPLGTGYKSGFCSGSPDSDDRLQCRGVVIQVQDITANTAPLTTKIIILRSPVTLVHGLWDSSSAWDGFFPLVTGPDNADARFTLLIPTYDDLIGNLITDSDPPYPQGVRVKAANNSLGFKWNASNVLSHMKVGIKDFKNGNNILGIPAAAVQSDVVGHSMGGLIARTMVLQAGFLDDNLNPSYGQGYIHKLITIDSPHLGSTLATRILDPLESGGCLQGLLAGRKDFAFKTVTIEGVSIPGAVGDLIDSPLSDALNAIASNASHPLPTSMIAGVYTNFAALRDPSKATIVRNWPLGCPNDTLAQQLTEAGWPQIFSNQPNDAIVSETSQFNNLSLGLTNGNEFYGYVHSHDTEDLGFAGPSVMDSGNVPNRVIFLLNRPLTDTGYYVLMNP